MPSVLVVADHRTVREGLGAAIEDAGFDVLTCPGPRAPGYECYGGRGERCPLAAAADAVVIDCDLASDAAMQGTPSWYLVHYYRSRGIPVVALTDGDGIVGAGDPQALRLSRRAGPDVVVAAIRRARKIPA